PDREQKSAAQKRRASQRRSLRRPGRTSFQACNASGTARGSDAAVAAVVSRHQTQKARHFDHWHWVSLAAAAVSRTTFPRRASGSHGVEMARFGPPAAASAAVTAYEPTPRNASPTPAR